MTGDETTLAALEALARGSNFAKPSRGGTVYLRPGELFVGQANRIFTLLGACVAITLWHPARRIGGMCHFMLPARPVLGHHNPDGRYGDESFQMLCEAARNEGAPPEDCEFRVFGGADLVGSQSMLDNLGTRNVACALHQIATPAPCDRDGRGRRPPARGGTGPRRRQRARAPRDPGAAARDGRDAQRADALSHRPQRARCWRKNATCCTATLSNSLS